MSIEGTPERIVAAAIKENGVVFTGPHHHLIIWYIVPILGIKTSVGQQGFITNRNRFVSRGEAADIAFMSKQISRATNCLFSEQLWEASEWPLPRARPPVP